MSLTPGRGFELQGELTLETKDSHLAGAVPLMFSLRGEGDELVVSLRLQ